MFTRHAPYWMLPIGLATLTIVGLSILLKAPAQARPLTNLIPCSGSIQACLEAAQAGDTILIAPGRYTESLTLSKPISLTGENRETTIIHAVAGQRTLTVTGPTIGSSIVISGLTFTGGTADYGGGVLITDTAQPTLYNVSFKGNRATKEGGGLYTRSTLYLTNTEFISNSALEGGGGVRSWTILASGADFVNNDARIGGALYNGTSYSGSLNLSNVRFLSNTAEAAGAVLTWGPGTLTDCQFTHNESRSNYGGGLVTYGLGDVSHCRFEHNVSQKAGGGIWASGFGLTLTQVDLISNTALTDAGGGVFSYGRLFISGTNFISNTALSAGGVHAMGFTVIVGSHFRDNRTSQGGGGLSAFSDLVVSDTKFINNQTSGAGGGLIHESLPEPEYPSPSRFKRDLTLGDEPERPIYPQPVRIFHSRFEGNHGSSGGGLAIIYSKATLIQTDFISNTAWVGGGALLDVPGVNLVITHTKFLNNQATLQCGGIDLTRVENGLFVNTLFVGNVAPAGAAVCLGSEALTILHSTFVDPAASNVPAIVLDHNSPYFNDGLYLTNNIISYTTAFSNTGSEIHEDYNLFSNEVTSTVGVFTGSHSFIADPKFVDPLNGDYHLQFDSAAIDHGVDAGVYTDLDGYPRPMGSGFDIGAYEFAAISRHLYLPLIRK